MCACRDVDDIHDMMDDINEQNEIADEIGNALAQPIGFAAEMDEVSSHYNRTCGRNLDSLKWPPPVIIVLYTLTREIEAISPIKILSLSPG